MAEKPKKKPKKQEAPSVLGNLPSSRPQRIGGRRPTAPKTFDEQAAADAAAEAEPAPAKPRRAAAKSTAAKPRTTAAKPRATAARRKAAAPRTFEPTEAAEAAAGAADARAAGVPPEPSELPRGPRAVTEAAPGIGTTERRDEPAREERGRPSGPELVATAVRAAGEVAQLGFTIGGRLLKRAADRLPRP